MLSTLYEPVSNKNGHHKLAPSLLRQLTVLGCRPIASPSTLFVTIATRIVIFLGVQNVPVDTVLFVCVPFSATRFLKGCSQSQKITASYMKTIFCRVCVHRNVSRDQNRKTGFWYWQIT